MSEIVDELRHRQEHYEKRASALEAKWDAGLGMEGTVERMMKTYRQLAQAYALTIRDFERPFLYPRPPKV